MSKILLMLASILVVVARLDVSFGVGGGAGAWWIRLCRRTRSRRRRRNLRSWRLRWWMLWNWRRFQLCRNGRWRDLKCRGRSRIFRGGAMMRHRHSGVWQKSLGSRLHPPAPASFGLSSNELSHLMDPTAQVFSEMVRRHPTRPAWKRLVEGVQGHVEVERKVDAHEELPDEAK